PPPPHDWSEGWEYVVQAGPAFRRLFSLGFAFSRWQTVHYEDVPEIGPFEGEAFNPETWKPRAPVRSHKEMRDDDAFWAALRVMAFSDDAIRAAVSAGHYSDERASTHLANVLMQRRDRIGHAYLPKINPVVAPALDPGGSLTFRNAAVDYGVATAPRRYSGTWYAFDNTTRESRRIGVSAGEAPRLAPPPDLPAAVGSFVRVDVSAEHDQHLSWSRPIETYFRRTASGWQLVGLVRQPGK
ncbi:MAG TPA: hypothetical protein VMW48_07420, partial [Vicinamibacterales bacterium]|nr:hypothetical protein [Vicinamibacterales bacterium]